MNIKVLIASLLTIAGFGAVLATDNGVYSVSADEIVETTPEETPTETPEEEIVEYPCKVIVGTYTYGSIYVDKEYGYPGDLVTLHATPSLLCKVDEISVNGMVLTVGEDGLYTFVLTEGENVVNAVFSVSNEDVAGVIELIKSLEGKSFEDIFTLENLIIFITFLLSTVFGSGLLLTLIKNKATNAQLAENIKEMMNNETIKTINAVTGEFLEKRFGPAFEKVSEEMTNLDQVARTMANCFLLSQENTPEARLAVAKELTKLSEVRKDLAQQVREILEQQQKAQDEKEAEKRRAIEELEKANENIANVLENKKDNTSDESQGRY